MIKTIEQLLIEIRKELDKICDNACKDHHKERDGVILYEYDNFTEEWFCMYKGYVLEEFDFTAKTFRDLLIICLAKLKEIQE